MKIYPISTTKSTHKALNTTTFVQNNAITTNNNQELSGIPKSYISFGNLTKTIENDRQEAINKYLYYKEHANDYKEESYTDEKRAEKRINDLIQKRSYNFDVFGIDMGIIGTVRESECLRIRNEEYEKYLKEKSEFDKIMSNEKYYKGLIDTNDIEIYTEISNLLKNKENAIDNKIAGYDSLKKDVKKLIVSPIQKETAMNIEQKVPPSILFYGPIGCGKTALAKAIGEEAGCNVKILNPTTTDPENFEYVLTNALKEAQKYYKKQKQKNLEIKNSDTFKSMTNKEKAKAIVEMKSPRTIYIIDEIDRYLNPSAEKNSEELADINKTLLKGVLDHCSEKPDGEYADDAAGMTILFTTNYPTKVDTEISLRGGKCTRIPVSLPDESDIMNILKFYLEKGNKRIQNADNPENTLELIDVDDIYYPIYPTIINESKEKGAIAGSGLEAAVHQAITDYISNPIPENYVNLKLMDLLKKAKYRINAQKLQEFLQEVNSLGKIYKDIDKNEEYSLLKELNELDLINPQQLKKLTALDELENIKKEEKNNA